MSALKFCTIGYEGTTVGEFLAALQAAGVERVIDVRAVPNSRRPGFSKTPLRNALAEAGFVLPPEDLQKIKAMLVLESTNEALDDRISK